MQNLSSYPLPICLLFGSNVFMTTAWYWHLRYKEVPLFSVILISWGLAFIEYCLAVPANRFGSAVFSPAQLKTIQEVITLLVFAIFSALYLKSPLTWGQAFGFVRSRPGLFCLPRTTVTANASLASSCRGRKRPWAMEGRASAGVPWRPLTAGAGSAARRGARSIR